MNKRKKNQKRKAVKLGRLPVPVMSEHDIVGKLVWVTGNFDPHPEFEEACNEVTEFLINEQGIQMKIFYNSLQGIACKHWPDKLTSPRRFKLTTKKADLQRI
jgi:hypothetical protein